MWYRVTGWWMADFAIEHSGLLSVAESYSVDITILEFETTTLSRIVGRYISDERRLQPHRNESLETRSHLLFIKARFSYVKKLHLMRCVRCVLCHLECRKWIQQNFYRVIPSWTTSELCSEDLLTEIFPGNKKEITLKCLINNCFCSWKSTRVMSAVYSTVLVYHYINQCLPY